MPKSPLYPRRLALEMTFDQRELLREQRGVDGVPGGVRLRALLDIAADDAGLWARAVGLARADAAEAWTGARRYRTELTLDVTEEQYGRLRGGKAADGVAAAQRLRALLSLWHEDPALQARVLEFVRQRPLRHPRRSSKDPSAAHDRDDTPHSA